MELIVDPLPMAVDERGIVRVAGTRITLDTIVGAYNRGDTLDEIVYAFPALSLADVHTVMAYYLRHREIVDVYIAENRRKAEEALREYEARYGATPTRSELERRSRQRN